MADRLFLTDDTVGYSYDDPNNAVFFQLRAADTSAHGFSAGNVECLGPMPANGRVVDFQIHVNAPAVSGSGFVSGTVDALLRLNSANIMTTNPSISMAGSASAVWPNGTATNRAQSASAAGIVFVTSGVINGASAAFSAGDYLSIDWNARSVGSGAPTSAGTGLRAYVVVRYTAV